MQKFDSVLVCNGHYEAPSRPKLAGEDKFPGSISHSHDYKKPSKYICEKVVILGSSFSGEDIARDISSSVQQGFLVGQSACCNVDQQILGANSNIKRIKGTISKVTADSSVHLSSGDILKDIDSIILCTGYKFKLDLLKVPGLECIADCKLSPLYHH